jgi:GMP synthase-like glutamine amidotransferase
MLPAGPEPDRAPVVAHATIQARSCVRFLVAESETEEERARRRARVGLSAGESYAETLRSLVLGVAIDRITPADEDTDLPAPEAIAAYDAVFVSGSPLHVYDDTPETRRQLAFMRAVFASGTPSFGSCAGLQLAVAAAGGRVRSADRQEAGLARRIARTEAGRDHPLLAGRAIAWDAPAIHTDEVEALPDGATCLASNTTTRVQAAEVRCGPGIFWGVQYHPELSLEEIGTALRRQAGGLVEDGLALTEAAVEDQAALLEALHHRPDRLDLRWRLGIDAEVAERANRTRELVNFIEHLVVPTRATRRSAARVAA